MQLQFEKQGCCERSVYRRRFSLMADRMHISGVVYNNLLDNALKYSKRTR